MSTKKISELTPLDPSANLELTFIPVFDDVTDSTRKITLKQINDAVEASIPIAESAYNQANIATTNAGTADQKALSAGNYANSSFARANTSLNVSTGGTITGDITINGNVTVSGCTASFQVSTLRTNDPVLDLSFGTTGNPTQNAGIRILRGDELPVQVRWNEESDKWQFTNDGVSYVNLGDVVEVANNYVIASFETANTSNLISRLAYENSNSAYNLANLNSQLSVSNFNDANTAHLTANSSGIYANAAYGASNVADQRAVTSGDYANAAYLQANTPSQVANDAFTAANVADQRAVTSGDYANSSYIHANAVFVVANSFSGDAVTAGVYANNAYEHANASYTSQNTTGVYANAAFLSQNTTGVYANTAYDAANVADQRAVTSGVYANTAYEHANASYISQNTTGFYANTAYSHANNSFVEANNASLGAIFADQKAVISGSYANSAYLVANTADQRAVTSGVYANAAFTYANALSGGTSTDGWAREIANSASVYANAAYEQANTTNTLTQSAYDQANTNAAGADSWSREAANSASSYANSGFGVANTANTLAQSAFDAANNAVDSYGRDAANSASSYANSGFGLANTANTLAQSAFDAANNAVDSYVHDAANSASSYANSAYLRANTAGTGNGDVNSTGGGYVNNAVTRYDGTSGNNIQNSLVIIADDGAITAPNNTGSMIPFYYATLASFPSATNSHGAIAHAHDTGKMYYAHGGLWLELANISDITGTVTSVSGSGTVDGLTLTGTVTSTGSLTLGGTLAIAATQITSGTLPVSRGGTGVTSSTGTDNVVLSTNPTLVTPILGTPQSVTLTNATGLPTAGLVDNAVTNTKLRDSEALSVIGRAANSTGDPADIAAEDHQVLRRSGVTLAFGAVSLDQSAAVTGVLPVTNGGTGISSFGAGVATFLGTPTSSNLKTVVTDETGEGALVFATSPTLVTPILGTPQSATLTNATGLPLSTGVTGTLPVANGGTGTTTPALVAGTNVTISGSWPNQTINATAGSSSITWTITQSASSDYVFSGPGIEAGNTNDPVLYLYRGFTYVFVNNAGGSHPFAIRTAPIGSGGISYTSGVSGSTTGTQTFTVPMNAPSTLYYQCTSHSGMGNVINIV